jgi:hypothetical protein
MSEWTFMQKSLVVLAALQLLWAIAGFVAEPSFNIGADAPTEKVLGVDFNGYHALSGFLLFLPAFYFARRPDWALYYTLYIVAALYATGVWAFFTERPGWVFTFPNNSNDAIFHLATGTVFLAVALIQLASKPAGAGRAQA